MKYLNDVNRILKEKYPLFDIGNEYVQVALPLYYEDGDIYEIYLKYENNDNIIVTDLGTTLMRLSYTTDYRTSSKRKIIDRIIKSNYADLKDGEIIIKCIDDNLEATIFKLAKISTKITNISLFNRETIVNMFMEELDNYVKENLYEYKPEKQYSPNGVKLYSVDYYINKGTDIYLYGVSNTDKLIQVIMSLQYYKLNNLQFKSIVIFENKDEIKKKEYNRIKDVSDYIINVFKEEKEEIPNKIFKLSA